MKNVFLDLNRFFKILVGHKFPAIVIVEERAKAGLRIEGEKEVKVEGLPQIAALAEPGSPSFEFTNL